MNDSLVPLLEASIEQAKAKKTMNEVASLELVEQPQPEQSRALTHSPTPSDLLRIAIEGGADLDRLERLMNMQVQFEKREAEKAYNAAFSAFKSEAVMIIKNRHVTDGPLKGKRYAELFAVVNAATPALSRHGLSASWKLTKDDKDWIEVTCTLKHVGGFSESVSMGGAPDSGGAKNAIMARASTVTYLERYTFKAITGLSEQDDDNDGAGGKKDPAHANGNTGNPTFDTDQHYGLTGPRAKELRAAVGAAIAKFDAGDEWAAWEEIQPFDSNEEVEAVWHCLRNHSTLRASIKKSAAEQRRRDEEIANMPRPVQ